ncbi:uncharacterized protein LOC129588716 [Paramacrobiotus metropolitanus]|uniref:uncharacterized protein LOC129588716 n=1 Tax=Paramacrobiotus metropolitanus TaxID=2943436 RepID=UPI002446526B|nr:uncharacterized protein LOC129588716 [Paramacrobiotus metropolitanus]XP_055339038.1 uncharacterized protein LOC129588716 [Paramacrobiotus metropolitanus]
MLPVPVTVLLVVVVGLVNSQVGASPVSAKPQQTISDPSDHASGSPAADLSPSPDAGNTTDQLNFAQPNQKFVPPASTDTAVYATYWPKFVLPNPPGSAPPGQRQGPFGVEGGQPNDARVPLHQAKIPTSVPPEHSRLTYRWPLMDTENDSPDKEYQIHFNKRKDVPSNEMNSVADYVDLPDVEPSEIYMPMVNAKNKHGTSPPVAYILRNESEANSTDACITEIVHRSATTILFDFILQDGSQLDLDGFEVKYALADQPFEHAATRFLDCYSPYIITGLQPSQRYRFRVNTRVSGRDGSGQTCAEFLIDMPKVGAPLIPKAALSSTVSFKFLSEAAIKGEATTTAPAPRSPPQHPVPPTS